MDMNNKEQTNINQDKLNEETPNQPQIENSQDIINQEQSNIEEKIIDDKRKNKIKLKKKLKIFLISIIFLLVVSSVVGIVYNRYETLNKITIEDHELYQYLNGVKYDYTGKFSLSKSGEITNIEYKGINIEVDDTPIYYKTEGNKMILPKNMEIVFLRIVNKNYKLPYFSEIEVDTAEKETSAYLKLSEKNEYLEESFLYNGADLYVFLYETKITIDNKDYTLSPLSYINVLYKDQINMYDKQTDTYTIIPTHKKDVIAQTNDYKINLSTDMVLYDENSKLLIKNVDDLPSYVNRK